MFQNSFSSFIKTFLQFRSFENLRAIAQNALSTPTQKNLTFAHLLDDGRGWAGLSQAAAQVDGPVGACLGLLILVPSVRVEEGGRVKMGNAINTRKVISCHCCWVQAVKK